MLKKTLFSPALAFLLLFVGLWQILNSMGVFNESLIPAPSDIMNVAYQDRQEFFVAFQESLQNSFAGFICSAFLGISLALTFSFSSFLRRALLPWAVFFQTVPIIAIAPLLVIYFGFGSPTVLASSFIVSLFPVLANTLSGLLQSPLEQEQLFDLYEATTKQKLFKLRLPHSLPSVFAGLRVAAGLSVVGAVAGEFVAGGGLGAIIDAGRTQQRVDRVFAALILLAAIGGILIFLTNTLSFYLNKKRPYGIK